MKYAIAFGLISLLLVIVGFGQSNATRYLWLWGAFNFAWIAAGYAGLGTRVFGKRLDGRIPLINKVMLLPYTLYSWLVWLGLRLFHREDAFNTIDQNLVVGRRLMTSELPDGFDHYVDLTAEFEDPKKARTSPSYRCLPILDGSVPNSAELTQMLDSITHGRTYVHCAQGHGRAGLFALALLIHRGRADSVEAGLALLQKHRPAVHLNRAQLAFIMGYVDSVKSDFESF